MPFTCPLHQQQQSANLHDYLSTLHLPEEGIIKSDDCARLLLIVLVPPRMMMSLVMMTWAHLPADVCQSSNVQHRGGKNKNICDKREAAATAVAQSVCQSVSTLNCLDYKLLLSYTFLHWLTLVVVCDYCPVIAQPSWRQFKISFLFSYLFEHSI